MAIIGIFTKQENGAFTGNIETFTLRAQLALQPLEKRGENSPDYRVAFGYSDFGAAWERTGKQGRYLSVSLDDPTFERPVQCRLVKTSFEDVYNLIWDRPKRAKVS